MQKSATASHFDTETKYSGNDASTWIQIKPSSSIRIRISLHSQNRFVLAIFFLSSRFFSAACVPMAGKWLCDVRRHASGKRCAQRNEFSIFQLITENVAILNELNEFHLIGKSDEKRYSLEGGLLSYSASAKKSIAPKTWESFLVQSFPFSKIKI